MCIYMAESINSDKKTNLIKRKYQELNNLPKQTRRKYLFRFLILSFSILGLILQSMQLFSQYSSGQTVVNIRFMQIDFNEIPSISVCYPKLVSMERMVNRYTELRPIYQEYKNILNNFSVEDYKNETFIEFLNNFYKENFESFAENLTIAELYESSIPYEYHNSFKTIEITVEGIRRHINGTIDETTSEVVDINPIESILLPVERHGLKCFTFFNHLDQRWKEYSMRLYGINVDIHHNLNWFPMRFDTSHIRLSLHSPYNMPHRNNLRNFFQYEAGRVHDVTYSRWKTIKLPPNYDSMCRDYTTDDYYSYRSECVNHCNYKGLRGKCGECRKHIVCKDCMFRSTLLWRLQAFNRTERLSKVCKHFENNSQDINQTMINTDINTSKAECVEKYFKLINAECLFKCGEECVNIVYNYDSKKNSKIVGLKWNNELTRIRLYHNHIPDQITEHIPQMSFIQFAANFGGLLGMWLGLSALHIITHCFELYVN